MYGIDRFLEDVKNSDRAYNYDMISRAYEFANEAHLGQKRRSGEDYICHPIEVAKILLDFGMDSETLVAALLHDVAEDTEHTLEEIAKEFSQSVADLVDGVTKLSAITFVSREERQAENIRKMLLAMAKDVRVVIIKLADRLHNMRTIDALPIKKQDEKALETMEIYAPIAGRLGIRGIKEELEDICIRHLDPVACGDIENALNSHKSEREEFLGNICDRIRQRLHEIGEDPFIEGRVKSTYGIYRKMFIQGKAFEEIYDVYAVRIIVDSITECYNILGLMHDMFKPIPNRFKDYISTPKKNGYQSLHTTVLGREAIPFEIQIRTWDMHHNAEYGIAAHWKYKDGVEKKTSLEERLSWVRQIIEAQKESENADEMVRSIKSDLVPEEVFVLTPKGQVITLPLGATVIDFAYAIHTFVGHRAIGAKVDGKIVQLSYAVKTGEVIEILTGPENHAPSRDWLKIVKTSEARTKIRTWFKRECREENIVQGKTELEREFRRNFINLSGEEREKFLEELAGRQKMQTVEDMYAAIGYGGLIVQNMMPRIKEEYQKILKARKDEAPQINISTKPSKVSSGVIIEEMDNCLVKFAKCCTPLPGDDIVGFITRGFGVSVHKHNCGNVARLLKDEENRGRFVSAKWSKDVNERFDYTLSIYAEDRIGLVADISSQLNSMRVPIKMLNAREAKDGMAEIIITAMITGKDHLNSIIDRLRKIEGITEIL